MKSMLFVSALVIVVWMSASCDNPAGDTITMGALCLTDDPNTVEWKSYRDQTSAEFSATFAAIKSEYRIVDVEAYETTNGTRYAGIYRKNTDARAWAAWRNLSNAEYANKWQQHKDEGKRPIDVEAYQVGGTWFYAGVWVENCEQLAWASFRNLTSAEFSTNFATYQRDGYRPIDVEASPALNADRYAVIWLKNDDNLAWILLRDMTASEYAANFQTYADQGYRVLDLESYVKNGEQRYAAIWLENENGRAWQAWREMSQQDWANRWRDLTDKGFRPIDIDVYPTATGGNRYLGIWRQDGTRYDWPEKETVDNRVQQFMNDYNLVGISAVIAQNGQVVYRRGFGDADVSADKWAWSKTVYRTASVAKSISAIVAMRLQNQNFIDLDNDTRDYLQSLPNHHTHTLKNLLSHRGCVRHYVNNDPVWASPGYAFAQDAIEMYQDDPLQGFNGGAIEVCNEPNEAYSYSTHALTIFAAACEVAVGNFPFSEILTEEISVPFDITTLRMEDRSVSSYERAEIYDESNVAIVSPSDVTWKLAGGGMEISTYDLAQLAMKLVDNKLMPNSARTEMWTPPDGLSTYALGWGTGSHLGFTRYTHNGSQEGARSVWRLYPSERLVITVMTNRRVTETSGNSIDDLAADLADIVLP